MTRETVGASGPPGRRETRVRRLGAAVVAMVAGAAAAQALTFKVHFPTDPLGPAAFPVVGALLMGLGAASFWWERPVAQEEAAPGAMSRIGLALLSFLAFSLLLSPLGFVLATSLEFAALAVLFGGKVLRGLVAGLVFAVALFALFVFGLGLPLPLGFLLS